MDIVKSVVLRRKKQRKKVEDCHLHYPTAKSRPWADDPKVTLDYHSLFFLRGECLSILSTADWFFFLSISLTLYLPLSLSLWTLLWEMCPVVASLTLLGDKDASIYFHFSTANSNMKASHHDKRNKRLRTFREKGCLDIGHVLNANCPGWNFFSNIFDG